MANITLKQLRYFEAVARHGHFGHAAADCGISQPALSMQIKELETEWGAPLFERAARKVRLTRLGDEMLSRSRAILADVEELDNLARAARTRLTGQLRIGVIPTIAPYLLPALIRQISDHAPALELNLRETLTPTLLRELARGRLDMAIMALPVSEPGLTELPLFEERFLLVRPAADAGTPVPSPEGLRDMRLLLLEEGHCFRDQALSFCDMTSARPREMLDASSLSTLVQMVGAGIGVTLIPEMAVAVETRSADVSVARFAAPEPVRQIGMVWRSSNPLGPRLQEFGEMIRQGEFGSGTSTQAGAGSAATQS